MTKLNVFYKDELKKVPLRELLGKTLYLDNRKNFCSKLYKDKLRTIIKVYISKFSTDEKIILNYNDFVYFESEDDFWGGGEYAVRDEIALTPREVEHLYFATGKTYFNPNAVSNFNNAISVIVKMNFRNSLYTGLYEYISFNMDLKPGDKVWTMKNGDFGEVLRVVEKFTSYNDKVKNKYGKSVEVIKMDEDLYNLYLGYYFTDKPKFHKDEVIDDAYQLFFGLSNSTFFDLSLGLVFLLKNFTTATFKDIYARLSKAYDEQSREHYDILRYYQIEEQNPQAKFKDKKTFLVYALCHYYRIADNITSKLGELYFYETV